MVDSIQVRGEGGGVFTLDLPLHEAIKEQLVKGTLFQLDADGNPIAYEPETAPDAEPETVEVEASEPLAPPAAQDPDLVPPPVGDAKPETEAGAPAVVEGGQGDSEGPGTSE